jgi:hypothetical protein
MAGAELSWDQIEATQNAANKKAGPRVVPGRGIPVPSTVSPSLQTTIAAPYRIPVSPTVDAFIEDGHKVGVRGVPAMGWPNRRAIVGLMPPTELVARLRNEAPERLRE